MLLVSDDVGSAGLAAAWAAGAEVVDPAAAGRLFPALRSDVVTAGAYDDDCQDIDATTAVEAHRSRLKSNGGELRVRARVTDISPHGGSWHVETAAGPATTGLVVDAAGAWADEVAALAGLPPIGMTAYRRTACTFAAPAGVDVTQWPLLMDADDGYYLKPESDGFMASPADETAQAPGPARARMEDVAAALDYADRVTTLAPRSIRAEWAGLRTFAPDRAPVLGLDPEVPGFAWCAAVGGFGIMTAPAAARAVVSLIDHHELPAELRAHGARAADVLPDRFGTRG
jgi:D-arginine dehydrogenase